MDLVTPLPNCQSVSFQLLVGVSCLSLRMTQNWSSYWRHKLCQCSRDWFCGFIGGLSYKSSIGALDEDGIYVGPRYLKTCFFLSAKAMDVCADKYCYSGGLQIEAIFSTGSVVGLMVVASTSKETHPHHQPVGWSWHHQKRENIDFHISMHRIIPSTIEL